MIKARTEREIRALLTTIGVARVRQDYKAAARAARDFVAARPAGAVPAAVASVGSIAITCERLVAAGDVGAVAQADSALRHMLIACWQWLDGQPVARGWMERELREAAR